MKPALVFLLLSSTAFAQTVVHARRPLATRSAAAVYYANAYADHYHLPRELVAAIITQESGWKRSALSSKGAIGLMQLMPATAARFGVQDPSSIADNIGGGVRYLAFLNQMFHGDLRMVVAAYYCGEGPILHKGLQYHNVDVIAYVSSVEKLYDREFEFQALGSRKGIYP